MTVKSRLELAVGLFIAVGLVILVSFVFLIKDFQLIKRGYTIDILFGFANGVKMSAPVRLAGVDIGEVKAIDVFQDASSLTTRVKIKAWVEEEAKIPVDSQVLINTLGILGEKYIEIIPGANYNKLVGKNEVMFGKDPVSMEEITEQSKKLILKFEDTLNGLNKCLSQINSGQGTLGKFIYDEQMYTAVNKIIDKIDKGEGTLGKLISDSAVYDNFQELSSDLKHNPWKLLFKPKEAKKKQ